ncbi:hypothetical protein MTO96_011297 [Rhipicephalus appendiculatus]
MGRRCRGCGGSSISRCIRFDAASTLPLPAGDCDAIDGDLDSRRGSPRPMQFMPLFARIRDLRARCVAARTPAIAAAPVCHRVWCGDHWCRCECILVCLIVSGFSPSAPQ